jgi:tetratricopeptide (TPR) repeat protein
MKRSISIPALLLTALLIIPGKTKAQDLNSAITLTRSEQYDKAAAMLEDLIKKEPANSKNYFYLGENYLSDYASDTISNSITVAAKDAREVYQKGVEANPNDPLNYVGLAKVAFLLGDDKTAVDMRAKAKSFLLPYKNLKKINPPAKDYAYTLAKIAESYIKNGEVDTSKALPLVREAIRIDNKNRDVYLIAGDIYILVNDGSKAINMYNQAQFADPQSPTAAMKIGNIYVKGRAYTAAQPYFEQAIELNANYAPAYRELGQLFSLSGVYAKSKQFYEKYLELTAGNIPAQIRYVNALFFSKDYEGVIKNVEDIFKKDQSRSYMNRIAGYSSFEKEPPDYNQALNYMNRLFQTVTPERIIPKDYLYLARILTKKNADYGKMTDELASLKQQIEKEKGRSSVANAAEKVKIKASTDEINNKIAELEKQIAVADGEINRAFDAYNKALAFKPDDKNLLTEIVNTYRIFKKYDMAGKTLSKLLDPAKPTYLDDLTWIGRYYYMGNNLKSADSVFNSITQKNPDYLPAYLWAANTSVKQDPDYKLGLAKPKFEKILNVAKKDSVKNAATMMDAMGYLSYFHMINDNYSKARDYYNRMINLSDNKEYKIKGYNGLGTLELRNLSSEKTNEGKLPILAKASESFNKILSVDPNNASAKSQINWIRDYQIQIQKGINPNEIKGVVKNAAGAPIPYASIRVKDTAAENLTNGKGEYKFEIPQDSETLIVSAKGYKAVEIPITKTRIYNVTLEQ